MTRQKIRYKSLVEALNRFVACVAGMKRGGGKGGGREFGQKRRIREGGKRTPAIKTPIGSFLRLLAAAKF